jgi:hypothetical protein
MIQRIQSVYLIVSIVILSLLYSNPVSEIIISDKLYLIFKFNRITSLSDTEFNPVSAWPVAVLFITVLLIELSIIFLYQFRILQMRLCIFNIFLKLGMVGMIYFFTKWTLNHWNGKESVFLWPVVIPFISIILSYLSFKGIQKDENLVRSYDRIR